VDVVPLFLGAGGHVRKDLPALMSVLRVRHPQVQWVLHRAVGEEDGVIVAMAQAALGLAAGPALEPQP
jgi:sirohydrochlorin cobaltochelatase